MTEIQSITEAYRRAAGENVCAALATVVRVEGSAYRQPGARMLVTEDGRMTGVVSGGCLEGDVRGGLPGSCALESPRSSGTTRRRMRTLCGALG